MYPEKGTVSFSAGLHGWAFTLTSFAKIYAKKFGTDEVKMMEKLWGDNFFDPKTKKWSKKQTDSASCKRGFCQFVYEPIKVIIEACMADDKKKLFSMLEKLGISDKLRTEDKEKTGKPLMKAVMQASFLLKFQAQSALPNPCMTSFLVNMSCKYAFCSSQSVVAKQSAEL